MGRHRFVQPDIVRLDLSDGDYIDIKKELNSGENRRVFARLVKDMRAGEKITLEPEQVGLTKIVEYLIGWSFTDANGKPVDVSEGAIQNLDQDTYSEISKAIDAHEEKIEAERVARKKREGWDAYIRSDLSIARKMNWRYEWVSELPQDVYDVLIEMLHEEAQQAQNT